jgi:hypothetical protein
MYIAIHGPYLLLQPDVVWTRIKPKHVANNKVTCSTSNCLQRDLKFICVHKAQRMPHVEAAVCYLIRFLQNDLQLLAQITLMDQFDVFYLRGSCKFWQENLENFLNMQVRSFDREE